MTHLVEFVQWGCTGTLGGRIWRDPVGMFDFDALKFVEQPVVFGIADERRIQHVITIIVQVNLFFEFFVMGVCCHI